MSTRDAGPSQRVSARKIRSDDPPPARMFAGSTPRARAIALGIFGLAVAIQGVSNASSAVTDRLRDGLAAWEPWCWELTSIAALLVLAPLVWRAVKLFRPPLALPVTRWASERRRQRSESN